MAPQPSVAALDNGEVTPLPQPASKKTGGRRHLHPGVSGLSGASAGLISALLFQPLDLAKTRLQVAATANATTGGGPRHALGRWPAPGRSPAWRPVGTVGTLRAIAAAEGVPALWTGLGASLIRLGTGVGLYFSTLTFLESQLAARMPLPSSPTPLLPTTINTTTTNSTNNNNNNNGGGGGGGRNVALRSFAVGAGARTLSGLVLLPVTVVKARLESGMYRSYGGVFSGLRIVARSEGARGLFAGLSVTLLRDAPSSGVYYVLFREMQAATGARDPDTAPAVAVALNALSGVVAGATTALLTQPLDVVKTQMQTRSADAEAQSALASVASIVRQQGFAGLMSGFFPRASRRTLLAAVSWTVYEYLNPVYARFLDGGGEAVT